mmetsp:Transcript_9253/g.13529  ORF Transcript_9253/g.13529 Transcript_9253/m.13529 type:complete len:206 (-) Transcript_9253:396-1013(-)
MSASPRCTVMSDPSGKSTSSVDAIPSETPDEKRKRLSRESSGRYREKKRRDKIHLTTSVVDIEERKRRSNMKAAERMRRMRERKRGSLSLQSSPSQPKDQSTTHNEKDMPTDEEKEQKKDRQRRQAAERMRRMRERKRASQPTMPSTSSNEKEHDSTNEEKQKNKNKENQQDAERMRRMRMGQGNLRIHREIKRTVGLKKRASHN